MKRYYPHLHGNLQEQIACEFLRNEGYRVLARNFTTLYGEIDIIVCREDEIRFVEVKSLNKDFTSFEPEDSVTREKMKKIFSCSLSYLRRLKRYHAIDPYYYTFSFDVIAMRFDKKTQDVHSLKYYPDFYKIDQKAMHEHIFQ